MVMESSELSASLDRLGARVDVGGGVADASDGKEVCAFAGFGDSLSAPRSSPKKTPGTAPGSGRKLKAKPPAISLSRDPFHEETLRNFERALGHESTADSWRLMGTML